MNFIVILIVLLICTSAVLVYNQSYRSSLDKYKNQPLGQPSFNFDIKTANRLDHNELNLLRTHFPAVGKLREHVAVTCRDPKLNRPIGLYLLNSPTGLPIVNCGNLCVSQPYRRRGIGNQLVKLAEQWAQRQGKKFIVVALPLNYHHRISFFTNKGYIKEPTQSIKNNITLIKKCDN